MAFLKHDNIKVLQNGLKWQKNGMLHYIATTISMWLGPVQPDPSQRMRLSPIRCKVLR